MHYDTFYDIIRVEEEKMEKEKYMKIALKEAEKAKQKIEVPIGAVIVSEGKIIARAHN